MIDVSQSAKEGVFGHMSYYLGTSPGHASRRSCGVAILLRCRAWLGQRSIDVRRPHTADAAAVDTLVIVVVIAAFVLVTLAVVHAGIGDGVVWEPNPRLGFARLPAACCQHEVSIDVATVPIRRSRLLQELPSMQRLTVATETAGNAQDPGRRRFVES